MSHGKTVSQDEISGTTALEKIHVKSSPKESIVETGSNNAADLMIINWLDACWGHE